MSAQFPPYSFVISIEDICSKHDEDRDKWLINILFGIRKLSSSYFKQITAYRRVAYEALKSMPEFKGKIDETIFDSVDESAEFYFYNHGPRTEKFNKKVLTQSITTES